MVSNKRLLFPALSRCFLDSFQKCFLTFRKQKRKCIREFNFTFQNEKEEGSTRSMRSQRSNSPNKTSWVCSPNMEWLWRIHLCTHNFPKFPNYPSSYFFFFLFLLHLTFHLVFGCFSRESSVQDGT